MTESADELRAQILEMVGRYYAAAFPAPEFVPGETPVPISGKVFDDAEIRLLVDAGLDFWLTTGRYAAQFEDEFARLFGLRHAMLTNSGSSANLLALTCLTSPALKDRALLARRRSHHRRLRLPDHRQPHHPERARSRLRGREVPTYNVESAQLEAASRASYAGGHVGAHARQPVRLGARHRVRREDMTCGWSRTAATPSARPTAAATSGPSAIWRPSASTPRTTSRWARAAAC